jgi:hypothetical protein
LKIIARMTHAPPVWLPLNRDQREHRDAEQGEDGDGVLRGAQHRPVPDQRDREVFVEQRAVRLDVHGAEDDERPEHDEVRGPGDRPLQQLLLREDLDDLAPQRGRDVLDRVVDAVRRRLALHRQGVQPHAAAGSDRDDRSRHGQAEDQTNDHEMSPTLLLRPAVGCARTGSG